MIESNGMNVSFPQARSDATMGDLLSEQQEVHPMKEITTLGIDLAKNIFQLHGADRNGKTVLRKAVTRSKLLETLVNLPPCLVGMEACGGAHHWARKISELGHTVRLIAPQFVTPYRKSGKNDANDAEAICEAVARPNMRFVPVKTPEQQAALTLHRVRWRFQS